MRTLTATHEIDCSVESYWKAFLDEKYTTDFLLGDLGFPEAEVLEQTESMRRLRVVPKLEMPGPVMKLLGDRFGYEERGTLDREKNEWRWEIVPNTLASKLSTSGITRLEAAGDGRCRRVDEATVEARVFGLGKLIESSTEKELRAAWDAESRFLEQWVKKSG